MWSADAVVGAAPIIGRTCAMGRYSQDADAELCAVMVDIAIDRPVSRETAQSTTHDEPAPE
jgi:alanine dehydrogenase